MKVASSWFDGNRGMKPRLLLVEDDPGLAVELLKWHLEREAFEVDITPDGER